MFAQFLEHKVRRLAAETVTNPAKQLAGVQQSEIFLIFFINGIPSPRYFEPVVVVFGAACRFAAAALR